MQLSLAASALLAVLVSNSMIYLFDTYRRVQTDVQLQESGRYMLAALEKDIGLESTYIVLRQEKEGTVIKCRTRAGRKNFTFYREGRALYKNTGTGSGTGKNPLYLPDCTLAGWKAERLREKMVLLTFTLEKDGRQRRFQRLIYCVNGRVENES